MTYCSKQDKIFSKNYNDPFSVIMGSDSYIADRLSMPVGEPPLNDYYNAQLFGVKNSNFGNKYHLGEDWNGLGGGDTDLGDPVYSIGNGIVLFAGDAGPGWGNVVLILHRLKNDKLICSLYGHLHDYFVKQNEFVQHRFQIGSIGNANGIYYAHLHFEIRDDVSIAIGAGYSNSTKGYLQPSSFIKTYNNQVKNINSNDVLKDKTGSTIKTRFAPPPGFKRSVYSDDSFESYMQNLPLKPYGHQVRYFNNKIKPSSGIYISVLDFEIGNRDLLQCADAVMLLRAEYLYNKSQFSKIKFNFLSDGKPRYYTSFGGKLQDYNNFRKYMDYIFTYANTASLIRELHDKDINDISPGDIFIQTRNPYGHAVIVVDTAISESGEKVFMLAQSYMPAQEIQILINPENKSLSPWYKTDSILIKTPEWIFYPKDLKSF